MGTVRQPVGPLPPGVYWLRRLLALAVVVLVLLAGRWVWSAAAGDSGAARPSASPSVSGSPRASSPAPSASPTATASRSASPSSSASRSSTARPSPTTTESPLCAAADLRVAVSTDSSSYGPGEKPRFTLTVTNQGRGTCRRDVGRRALELQVTSGSTRIWSSDDCSTGGSVRLLALDRNETFRTTVVWDRTQSSRGCPTPRPAVPAGTYQVVGRDLDLRSGPVTFTLR